MSVCARERGTEEQREGDFKMVEIEGGWQNGQEDEEDTSPYEEEEIEWGWQNEQEEEDTLPNEQEEVRAKASQRN